jgi:HrpA-like RNA helicase
MDDDEPVYRRYYRDINDNQKFPLDCNLRDFNLDRVNVDRRYHISPVGLGTTHKIEETYLDGSNPVDIVKMLVRDGLKGDILIFQPGEGDIVELVEELNENTPDDVIALPFYSALSDDKKKKNFQKLMFYNMLNNNNPMEFELI